MFYFSNIKIKICNFDVLKIIFINLGLDWKEGLVIVWGYQGLIVKVVVVIEQSNDYDLGFSWNGQEYELVIDLQYW